jgi:hypothetical protein
MKPVLLSAGIGLLAPFVVAVVLFSAAFQSWVARRLARAKVIQWPVVLTMIVSLLTVFVLLSAQDGLAWLYAGA